MDNDMDKNAGWVRPTITGVKEALKYLRHPIRRTRVAAFRSPKMKPYRPVYDAGVDVASAFVPGMAKTPRAKAIQLGLLGTAGGAYAHDYFTKHNDPEGYRAQGSAIMEGAKMLPEVGKGAWLGTKAVVNNVGKVPFRQLWSEGKKAYEAGRKIYQPVYDVVQENAPTWGEVREAGENAVNPMRKPIRTVNTIRRGAIDPVRNHITPAGATPNSTDPTRGNFLDNTKAWLGGMFGNSPNPANINSEFGRKNFEAYNKLHRVNGYIDKAHQLAENAPEKLPEYYDMAADAVNKYKPYYDAGRSTYQAGRDIHSAVNAPEGSRLGSTLGATRSVIGAGMDIHAARQHYKAQQAANTVDGGHKAYASPGLLDPDLRQPRNTGNDAAHQVSIADRLGGLLNAKRVDPVKALAPSYGGSEEVARQQIEQANALRAKYPNTYGLQPVDTVHGIRATAAGSPAAIANKKYLAIPATAAGIKPVYYEDADGHIRSRKEVQSPLVLTWPASKGNFLATTPESKREANGLANANTDVDTMKYTRAPSIDGHEFTHAVNFASHAKDNLNKPDFWKNIRKGNLSAAGPYAWGEGVHRLAAAYPEGSYGNTPAEAVQNAAQMKRLARHNFNQAEGRAPVSESDWRKAYGNTLGYKIPSAGSGATGVQPMNLEHARFINYMIPGKDSPYKGEQLQQQYDSNVNKFIDSMLKRNPDGTFFQDGIVRNSPRSVVKQASWESAAQWVQERIKG